ncbi:DUF167 domain-containing protein [Candidatus Saccharibacteria bacterium]|nr:DUF167 domain-containing protein [Candidatus Saccharibacteria bacterium]MBI3337675.1 DUF167 domain-containing protein [Candidatus Saccharibacteria bacterium]
MKVTIRVKPGSKKGSLVQPSLTGELLVYVSEPAVEAKANRAVIDILADYYDVPKSNVKIVGGHKSRNKIVNIEML